MEPLWVVSFRVCWPLVLSVGMVMSTWPLSVDGLDSLAGSWLGYLAGMLVLTAGL